MQINLESPPGSHCRCCYHGCVSNLDTFTASCYSGTKVRGVSSHQYQWADKYAACLLCQGLIVPAIGSRHVSRSQSDSVYKVSYWQSVFQSCNNLSIDQWIENNQQLHYFHIRPIVSVIFLAKIWKFCFKCGNVLHFSLSSVKVKWILKG